MTNILIILCVIIPLAVAAVALALGLAWAAADTRAVDDGRAFGGDDE